MIKRDVALYTYRLFTSGGHSFICLAEQDNIMDFRDEIKVLKMGKNLLWDLVIHSEQQRPFLQY